jgi:hypothetical protein
MKIGTTSTKYSVSQNYVNINGLTLVEHDGEQAETVL